MTLRNIAHRPLLPLALMVLLASKPSMLAAQQPPDPPSLDDQIEEAEARKKLAELEAAIAEAEKKEREAKLPSSQSKGASGTVTLNEGAGYYAEILAYRALDEASATIAGDVVEHTDDKTLIITTQFDAAAHAALWTTLDTKLEDIEEQLTKLIRDFTNSQGQFAMPTTKAVGAALIAIPAFLGAAADIAAFFRVDREFTARELTLSQHALVASLAHAIHEEDDTVPVLLPELNFTQPGKLAAKIQDVLKKRRQAIGLQFEVKKHYQPKLDDLATKQVVLAEKKELLKIETDPAKKATLQREILTLESEVTVLKGTVAKEWADIDKRFEALITAAGTLVDSITSAPKGERSPLEVVTTIDAIQNDPSARVLVVATVSQGAEIEVMKSAWRSGRVSYIGGTVVAYVLLKGDGTYVHSGLAPLHLAESFKGAPNSGQFGASSNQTRKGEASEKDN